VECLAASSRAAYEFFTISIYKQEEKLWSKSFGIAHHLYLPSVLY